MQKKDENKLKYVKKKTLEIEKKFWKLRTK